MQEQHQANGDRLTGVLTVLQKTEDIRAKSALWKFYNNTRLVWTELDKEMINCRRRSTVTLKYTELEEEFNETIRIFEQWAIMASLIYT
jgi:hypothetical protein